MSVIKQKLSLLPQQPGCYLMKDQEGLVIYVGKAKKLKNRVRSYFIGAHNEKTTRLVSDIRDFDYILTHSEQESLILELNLIKQYSPKYNIRLMDDKTYPYILLTEETYPKLEVVRDKHPKGRVFGPYPNVYAARETVNMLNRIYPLRKCDVLPKEACLYFHIGQCAAPCIFPDVKYDLYVKQIIQFLKGDTKEVLSRLQAEMKLASEAMMFEKAAEFRDMIKHIEQTTEKQRINLNDYKNRDVIAYVYNEQDVAIEIFMLRQGRLIDHQQTVFEYTLDPQDAVISYLSQLYETVMPDEILFHDACDELLMTETFHSKAVFPKKGDKKQLTDLAYKNAKESLEHYFMLHRHEQDKKHQALSELSKILTKDIKRIDVIDNAQLFGASPISAVIVYEGLEFNKKMYRKYHLKTTTNDDYQAMREVIYRRYQRHLADNLELPDFILVDGGIGQVHVALEVIESLGIQCIVGGLKKNKRHQLESLILENQTISLSKHGTLYKLLYKLSEEVHRFAVTFHRQTRQKSSFKSQLDQISGIGPKRKSLLIKNFGTFERIVEQSDDTLKSLGIPEEVIINIRNHHEKNHL